MWYNMICGFKPRFVCYGGVAQLGERCVRNAEVMGSNPTISTNKRQSAFADCLLLLWISDSNPFKSAAGGLIRIACD